MKPEIELITHESFYDHHIISELYVIKGTGIFGTKHREDGPAQINWYAAPYNNIRHQSPYTKVFITDETYFINGVQTRVDGPSHISYNQYNDGKSISYAHYCVNGKFHRIDGPARIWYETEYDVEDNETTNYNKITSCEYYLLDIVVSGKDFNTPEFIDAFILEHS